MVYSISAAHSATLGHGMWNAYNSYAKLHRHSRDSCVCVSVHIIYTHSCYITLYMVSTWLKGLEGDINLVPCFIFSTSSFCFFPKPKPKTFHSLRSLLLPTIRGCSCYCCCFGFNLIPKPKTERNPNSHTHTQAHTHAGTPSSFSRVSSCFSFAWRGFSQFCLLFCAPFSRRS